MCVCGGGGGGPSSLKFLPTVVLGGGVKFLIYSFGGGGGVRVTWKPHGYTLVYTGSCRLALSEIYCN